jgi:hypothetical protein
LSQSKQFIEISYTNILFRTLGLDSKEKEEWQAKIIESFGLYEIENLRKQYSSREGLLIDFDYVSDLAQSANKEESENTTSVDNHPGDEEDGPSVQSSGPNEDDCQKVSGIRTVRLF